MLNITTEITIEELIEDIKRCEININTKSYELVNDPPKDMINQLDDLAKLYEHSLRLKTILRNLLKFQGQ